jgi:hypothetical protein
MSTRWSSTAAAAVAALLGAQLTGGALAAAAEPSLEPAADRIVTSTPIASPAGPQGEVRLIERGDADVVQTLLRTKLLRRVVAEIRKKEMANWPPDRPGHADAERYVAALEQVATRLAERQPANRKQDRALRVFIDFVLTSDGGLVGVGTYTAESRDGQLRVTESRPMERLVLSRDYVRANMRLIVADSFHLDGAPLDATLAPLTLLGSGS